MTIPLVVQGTVETEDGKVFELDSPKGSAWLESIGSFRFEPTGANKPYTVRKESGKGGDYWYGYRKVAGKLHKKYIGKSSELNTAKLEEIAEALNTPPQPRVTGKVTDKVTQVTETNTLGVIDKVTYNSPVTPRVLENSDRLTALELQVRALQESLEALKIAGLSDSPELLKPNAEVTDSKLQTVIGNLQAENESLRQELTETKRHYIELLENSATTIGTLKKELEVSQTDNQRLHNELGNSQTELTQVRSQLEQESADREEIESELADLKQKSATANEFPEAADLLNQLKAKHKKSTASLADIETILEMME
jgi:DNA repair exonuclease SbcCD ATPase subunit